MLTLFTARLVVDEVVPPVFLTRVLDALRPGTLGVAVVRNAGNLLKSPHAAERITQARPAEHRAQQAASCNAFVRVPVLFSYAPWSGMEHAMCIRGVHGKPSHATHRRVSLLRNWSD